MLYTPSCDILLQETRGLLPWSPRKSGSGQTAAWGGINWIFAVVSHLLGFPAYEHSSTAGRFGTRPSLGSSGAELQRAVCLWSAMSSLLLCMESSLSVCDCCCITAKLQGQTLFLVLLSILKFMYEPSSIPSISSRGSLYLSLVLLKVSFCWTGVFPGCSVENRET